MPIHWLSALKYFNSCRHRHAVQQVRVHLVEAVQQVRPSQNDSDLALVDQVAQDIRGIRLRAISFVAANLVKQPVRLVHKKDDVYPFSRIRS
jgi:hypothetical protein